MDFKFGAKFVESNNMGKYFFGIGLVAGILIAIILIGGVFAIKILLPKDTGTVKTTQQTDNKSDSADSDKTKKEEEPPLATIELAKNTVQSFHIAFMDSAPKDMKSLLIGDAYDKFNGKLDAIPYKYEITDAKEFDRGLFSFEVTTYFKGDKYGPYLEDWVYKVAKTDEGDLKIYERKLKNWTYFTPEM